MIDKQVWKVRKWHKGPKLIDNVLMLLPVTGRSGGKRKSTVVTIT